MTRRVGPRAAFVASGAGIVAFNALLALWVPLLPTNVFRPLLDLGKITGYTWASTLHFTAILVGLFLCYLAGYLLVRRAGSLRLVLLFSFLAGLALVGAYPATAVDVFGYAAQGRVLAVYGANPLVISPGTFRADPIIPFLAFPLEPSQYGPAWVLISAGVAWVANGNRLLEVVLFKGLALLAHLLCTGLVYRIASRLSGHSGVARASALLFGWNPLLLWEMVGNAHNDGLMTLAGLAAAALLVEGRAPWLVLPLVTLGALIKLPIIGLVPVFAVFQLRRTPGALVEGCIASAALAFAFYHPFWEGLKTVTALGRANLFTASFGSALRLLFAPRFGSTLAESLASRLSLALLLVVMLAVVWRAASRPSVRGALTGGYATLLALVLLGTTWFQAWYVVWPAALGAGLAIPQRHREVALLTLGAYATYLVFIYLWVMGIVRGDAVQYLAFATLVAPLLSGWLISFLSHWAGNPPWGARSKHAGDVQRTA